MLPSAEIPVTGRRTYWDQTGRKPKSTHNLSGQFFSLAGEPFQPSRQKATEHGNSIDIFSPSTSSSIH